MTVPDLFDQGVVLAMPTKKAPAKKAPKRTLAGLNDKAQDVRRDIGKVWIDNYESSVGRMVGLQRKAASRAKIKRVRTVLEAQADLVAGVGEATASASRKIIA